jgi:hypothetical protein
MCRCVCRRTGTEATPVGAEDGIQVLIGFQHASLFPAFGLPLDPG